MRAARSAIRTKRLPLRSADFHQARNVGEERIARLCGDLDQERAGQVERAGKDASADADWLGVGFTGE